MGRLLERELAYKVNHNSWIKYSDWGLKNGYPLYCEVDHWFERPDAAVVIEVKLTQKALQAWGKLQGLYGPLVARLTGKPVILVQVFKNMTYRDTRKKITSVNELLLLTPGSEATWQIL